MSDMRKRVTTASVATRARCGRWNSSANAGKAHPALIVLVIVLVVALLPVLLTRLKGVSVPGPSSGNQDRASENDIQVIGHWTSVDFVKNISDFTPGRKSFNGSLFLKEFVFAPNGKTHKPFWTWTEGSVYHSGEKTTAKYVVKRIGQEQYLFLEWISGDVTIRGQKPWYYVLKKEN